MAAAFQADAFQNDAFQTLAVEIPVQPPINVSGGPPGPQRRAQFEQIDARAEGQLLVIRLSLIPGTAIGSAKAFGDTVQVVNAKAGGAAFDAQRWQVLGGVARSKIILTDEEEIMLILADAA